MTQRIDVPDPGKVPVESPIHPGRERMVDAAKYAAVREALLDALPTRPPGLTYAEWTGVILPVLSTTLFPGGAKAGWWTKTVQLDLEAKGLISREPVSPLRWHRAPLG
jgi:hypothetical protein